MLKKLSMMLVFICVLVFASACSNGGDKKNEAAPEENASKETRVYSSKLGDVKVPIDPKRVVVASYHYPGHFLSLGITPVAVYDLAKDSEFFGDQLKDAEVISDDSIEKILELEPDLIIANSNNKNVEKLKEIAPTVVFELGEETRWETFLEISKVVGKEDEAKKQIADWEKRVEASKQRFAKEFDTSKTISVLGEYEKQVYVYGPNHGRGTEVLYSFLELNYPQKLKDELSKVDTNYLAISEEVIGEYVGDYVFIAGMSEKDVTFKDKPVFQDLPAVKEGNAHFISEQSYFFTDPISLNAQLDYFEDTLLGK
ncbi:ABC transporter substrate-binding protein [Bacillaceae bacterium SAS-127]|nr:ABC transporter substrate-binding protein [Bacillaceae bacterium SAS-127]